MSIRSLLEFNHDYAHEITSDPGAFIAALRRYQNCADNETAADLERFGVRRVSVRHHADKFFIEDREDGFPAKYFNRSERSGEFAASAIEAAEAGETTKIGSTEGESAVPKADANTLSPPSAETS